ncbi:hypothetical protein ABIF91_008976 [Bradyrhizobium sp. USDA 241]
MGSLALSRAEVMDQPAPSIAGEVARIAREQLAPLAAGIDDGTVYPELAPVVWTAPRWI